MDLVEQLIMDWAREAPDLDAKPMAIVGRILHLGRVLENRANAVLKPYNLHYTDLDVLATLRRSGAPFRQTPTALRRSVLITSGAMTAALDRLERTHLIARELDDEDRRIRSAVLTDRGRTLIEEAIGARFGEAQAAISGLDIDERDTLTALLRKLASTMPTDPPLGPPSHGVDAAR
ncbi:MAG: MarR family winged helix-turn-helix transcriptional regulator [Maricaulaceae bacterium]